MVSDVGKRIAALRKQKGWSQVELAERLNVSDKAVSKWENGGMPSIDLFPQLARVFNVSIDYLMLGDEGYKASEENDVASSAYEECVTHQESSFESKVKMLSVTDMELILSDQRSLYTDEELEIIQERYEDMRQAPEPEDIALGEEKVAVSRLPKRLQCPKCDGINENPDRFCAFCGQDLLEYDYHYEGTEWEPEYRAGCLAYFLAFLIPIAGLIWGLVKKEKSLIIFSSILLAINVLSAFICANIVSELISSLDSIGYYYY